MSFYAMDTNTNETMTIYTGKELAKAVENSIEWYYSHAKALEKQNQRLMEDAKAVVEEQLNQKINNLEARLRRCLTELSSDKEVEMYKEFSKKHAECRLHCSYNILPYVKQKGTGIGIISIAVCPICGEEKDITDTEAW